MAACVSIKQLQAQNRTDSLQTLDSVMVQASTPLAIAKQQVIQVSVIDARRYYNRTTNMTDILNASPGIRVRQEGGLGSRAEFSLNGLSGKQVRYFLDGIPLEYLGAASALNSIPAPMIDHIEIYKGVVPVELGADALGGAIQLVSRRDQPNYINAAYEHSSFKTHKLNLNARYSWKNGWYLSTANFYNRTANNFKIDVEIPNSVGNPVPATVKRFHDNFESYRTGAEIGLQNRPWADKIAIGFAWSGINKDLQHNIVMTQPYGQAKFDENSLNTYIRWETKELVRNLRLQLFSCYNRGNQHFLDTSLNAYTWDGKVANQRSYGGEISASRNNLFLEANNMIGRANLTWSIDSASSVTANLLYTAYDRKGHDDIAAAYHGKDLFRYPTKLNKLVAGLAYQRKLFKAGITSISSVKFFSFTSDGFTVVNTNIVPAQQSFNRAGFNQAFKWHSSAYLQARLSYEYASRIPDENELFGDFILIRANPSILPENSHNVNAGVQFTKGEWAMSAGGFYRFVDNIIYLKTSQLFAQYQNLLRAQVTGVEGEMSYRPVNGLVISANATYQNIINKTSPQFINSPESKYYNLRLPNIPYLFGNGEVLWSRKTGRKKTSAVSTWYSASYVHWFYLYWSIDGRPDLKVTIPTQFVQNIGVSHSWRNGLYALTGEVHNLTNEKVFDNFSVQRPGRSFHIKLNILINSQQQNK